MFLDENADFFPEVGGKSGQPLQHEIVGEVAMLLLRHPAARGSSREDCASRAGGFLD